MLCRIAKSGSIQCFWLHLSLDLAIQASKELAGMNPALQQFELELLRQRHNLRDWEHLQTRPRHLERSGGGGETH